MVGGLRDTARRLGRFVGMGSLHAVARPTAPIGIGSCHMPFGGSLLVRQSLSGWLLKLAVASAMADFERLHSREHDRVAFLYAFDLLELDGVDVRPLPLAERKGRLLRLVQGCPPGIQFNDHIEGDGAEIFAHACKLALRASSRGGEPCGPDCVQRSGPLRLAVA